MEKQKSTYLKVADSKLFCMIWLLTCVAFVSWFGMLRVPLEGITPIRYSMIFEKTASVIAVTHPKLYCLYVLFMIVAVFLNVNYMYRHNDYEGKVGKRLMYVSFVCLIMTIIVPHAESGFPKLIHWSAALSFAFLCAAAIILFLAGKSKTNRRYQVTLILFLSVPVIMITLLILFGENGALEILPLWCVCLILFLVNFTGFYKEKPVKETIAAIK